MELTPSLFVAVVLIGLLCQYMSISLGAGYGTAVTPTLLIIGFSPLEVVPAVLLSQLAGGIIGGLSHHRAGNIDLGFKQDDNIKRRLRVLGYLPRSIDSKVILILAACGVIGVVVGVVTAVNISPTILGAYIGAMVLAIGLAILLQRNRKTAVSWRGLVALGLVGAFNKGLSGGGYVPLVTGGQIISGREAKSAVGSTTVAVAIVCMVGFLSYLLIEADIYWKLAIATTIGSIVAAPFAALTTKKVNAEKLRSVIGLATVVLGALTLIRTFVL